VLKNVFSRCSVCLQAGSQQGRLTNFRNIPSGYRICMQQAFSDTYRVEDKITLMLHTVSGCPNKYEYKLNAFATAKDCSRRVNSHICIITSMNAIIQNNGLTILKYNTRNCSYTWPIIVNNTGNARTMKHRTRSRNHCCRGKAVRITLSSLCACSRTYAAMRTRHIILPYVAYTASLYFSTARLSE
jgi:hypothetical protein